MQQAILTQDALTAPLPVPRVGAAGPAPAAPVPAAGDGWPLLGRAAPRSELLASLEEALSGRTTFACLVGEPGIGK